MSGELEILSVGKGHLTLTITEDNEMEIEKAKRIIEDMLRRGYSLFVETSKPGAAKKTYRKVLKFNPRQLTYIIDDSQDVEKAEALPSPPSKPATKTVSATKSKAVGVGRSAGG